MDTIPTTNDQLLALDRAKRAPDQLRRLLARRLGVDEFGAIGVKDGQDDDVVTPRGHDLGYVRAKQRRPGPDAAREVGRGVAEEACVTTLGRGRIRRDNLDVGGADKRER